MIIEENGAIEKMLPGRNLHSLVVVNEGGVKRALWIAFRHGFCISRRINK
jgi:hypothetical protein